MSYSSRIIAFKLVMARCLEPTCGFVRTDAGGLTAVLGCPLVRSGPEKCSADQNDVIRVTTCSWICDLKSEKPVGYD